MFKKYLMYIVPIMSGIRAVKDSPFSHVTLHPIVASSGLQCSLGERT